MLIFFFMGYRNVVATTGVEATGLVGTVSLVTNSALGTIPGVEAIGQVGDVGIRINVQFGITGVQGVAAVGTVHIWSLLSSPSDDIWTPRLPVAVTWQTVDPAADDPWKEIDPEKLL